MKYLLLTAIVLASFSQTYAQDEQADGASIKVDKSSYQGVKYKIVQLKDLYKNGDFEKYEELRSHLQLFKREDGKLRLQIENRNEGDFAAEDLAYLGVELDNGNQRARNVYIHPLEIENVISKLKEGHILSFSERDHSNQGPGLMNSDSYRDHASGNGNGSGINIAIIDIGFDSLTEAAAVGAVPPIASMTTYLHGTGPLQTDGPHGTACLETVFDSANGANYFLHKTSTYVDIQDAIDACIADNIDIISHSLSWFNSGWDDNEGIVADAFKDASDDGILIFTSAGNYANGLHDKQTTWMDDDNDDFFNWTPTDEGNSFTVANGCEFFVSLSWEGVPDPTFDDFDLYLYDTAGNLIDSSTSSDTYETVVTTNNSGGNFTYNVRVKNEGTDLNDFKLFFRSSECSTTFQYSTAVNSMTHPAISTFTNLHTVGAVYRTSYSIANADPIANYSSHGPSTNGSTKPDLTGPTGTTTVAYGGDFTGTSCSTPNVAGAAACLMSAHSMSVTDLAILMKRKAIRFLDWGAAGDDNVYGHGGVLFFDYHPDNIYVHQTDGTDNVAPVGGVYPWHNVQDYDNLGVADKKVIFLTDDSASAPALLDKQMFLQTLGQGTASRIID